MVLWRISNYTDFSGLGGEKSDGRWHSARRGKRIVYLAEHPAVSILEIIANLEGNPALFPDTCQLMKAVADETVSVEAVEPAGLSPTWETNFLETRKVGDLWLAEGRSALLAVPSVTSPESTNYLFNPLHRDAAGLKIEWTKKVSYDKRIFKLTA